MAEIKDDMRMAAAPHARARLAGFFYTIVVATGLFSLSYAADRVFAGGPGPALVQSITANETLLRALIAGELACYVAFLAVALALYRLLADTDQFAAMLMAGLAISSVPFGFANTTHLFEILRAIDAGGAGAQDTIVSAYHRYQTGLFVQSVPWGLWLVPFGYLVFCSGFLPRSLGVLLVLAGVGYAGNFLGRLLIDGYESGVLGSVFRVLRMSEILICLWLLVFGARQTLLGTRAAAHEQTT